MSTPKPPTLDEITSLNQIPLNELDQSIMDSVIATMDTTETERRIVFALKDGKDASVATHSNEEYIVFSVFLPKIRRESEGLQSKPREVCRHWYKMATLFLEQFGENRTPKDVKDCKNEVQNHWGF